MMKTKFGKKVGSLDLGGYSVTLGFGLRKKSWKFGFGVGVFWEGDEKKTYFTENLEIWILGGYSGTLRFELRKKSWKFGLGGIFWEGDGRKKKTYFTEKLI